MTKQQKHEIIARRVAERLQGKTLFLVGDIAQIKHTGRRVRIVDNSNFFHTRIVIRKLHSHSWFTVFKDDLLLIKGIEQQ